MEGKRSIGRDLFERLVAASRWAAPVFVAVIVVLSVVPGENRPHIGLSGNVEHLFAYAGTAFASVLAIRSHRLGVVVLFLLVLAGGLELAQIRFPGRSAGFDNWMASTAGAFVGAVLARFVLARVRR